MLGSSLHYTFINTLTMSLLPTLAFSFALLATLFAIAYQRRDMRPGTKNGDRSTLLPSFPANPQEQSTILDETVLSDSRGDPIAPRAVPNSHE